jgi:hypothetical protein
MGTTQERILEALKKSGSGMTPFGIADEIGYPTKTKMVTFLARLRTFGLVESKIINKKKLWFFVR